MYKYKVLVGGERIERRDFETSEELPECQLRALAYSEARKMGFSTFGINGVKVMRDVQSNGAR